MTYTFFTAQLRFIVNKTERVSDDIGKMMDVLLHVADQIDADGGSFFVTANELQITARALAGVAGFMQQHILPEVVATKNLIGERQVRWTVETCMSIMAKLTTHAELGENQDGQNIKLPPLVSEP